MNAEKAFTSFQCALLIDILEIFVHLDMRKRKYKHCLSNLYQSLNLMKGLVSKNRLNNNFCVIPREYKELTVHSERIRSDYGLGGYYDRNRYPNRQSAINGYGAEQFLGTLQDLLQTPELMLL